MAEWRNHNKGQLQPTLRSRPLENTYDLSILNILTAR